LVNTGPTVVTVPLDFDEHTGNILTMIPSTPSSPWYEDANLAIEYVLAT